MSHAEAMRSHPFDTTLNQRCVSHRVLPSDSYVRSTANAETHGDRTFPASSGTIICESREAPPVPDRQAGLGQSLHPVAARFVDLVQSMIGEGRAAEVAVEKVEKKVPRRRHLTLAASQPA